MTQTLYAPSAALQLADRIYKTGIPGLFFIAHSKRSDARGYFAELTIIDDVNHVLEAPFAPRQINLAYSDTHVTRGFHAENWNKLISLTRGTAFCAIADIRPSSPSFKQVETFLLGESAEALSGSLYVSKGLANSYSVLEGPANYLYLVDALYRERDVSNDQAVSLFDPDLAINWPIPREEMVISDRDTHAKTLQDLGLV